MGVSEGTPVGMSVGALVFGGVGFGVNWRFGGEGIEEGISSLVGAAVGLHSLTRSFL